MDKSHVTHRWRGKPNSVLEWGKEAEECTIEVCIDSLFWLTSCSMNVLLVLRHSYLLNIGSEASMGPHSYLRGAWWRNNSNAKRQVYTWQHIFLYTVSGAKTWFPFIFSSDTVSGAFWSKNPDPLHFVLLHWQSEDISAIEEGRVWHFFIGWLPKVSNQHNTWRFHCCYPLYVCKATNKLNKRQPNREPNQPPAGRPTPGCKVN